MGTAGERGLCCDTSLENARRDSPRGPCAVATIFLGRTNKKDDHKVTVNTGVCKKSAEAI